MDFSNWYREIEDETEDQVWCISLDCCPDFSRAVSEWALFLNQVAEIRGRRVQGSGKRTTYAWHDEHACQLRFATANCDPRELPFSCKVALQDSPDSIIESWLNGANHIPWDQLRDLAPNDFEDEQAPFTLRVWAIQIRKV